MRKDIFVRETDKGISITSPSGTVYTAWYFDEQKNASSTMKSMFYELEAYYSKGYNIKFEYGNEEKLDTRFSYSPNLFKGE